MKHLRFPKAPKRVAQKFHFAILRIEVTRASRGLYAIAELLVIYQFNREEILHAIVVKFTTSPKFVRTLLRKFKQQRFSVKTRYYSVKSSQSYSQK